MGSEVCIRDRFKTVRVQGHQTFSSQLSPESDARGYKISYRSELLLVLNTSIVCSGRGGGEPAVQKLRSSTPVAVALGDTRRTFTYRRYSTHQRCVAAEVRRPCPRALTVLTTAESFKTPIHSENVQTSGFGPLGVCWVVLAPDLKLKSPKIEFFSG